MYLCCVSTGNRFTCIFFSFFIHQNCSRHCQKQQLGLPDSNTGAKRKPKPPNPTLYEAVFNGLNRSDTIIPVLNNPEST
ncbi:hypothetical protein HanXRQr2_Chr11g0482581 [Helianthus annuus]|uniref:Uncharacterized protein n=1 Tax=Helianthus annuus TaxID=4232 RepID=A0A9K3HMT8_HELAN|nr:hypothetical protein HanXRQr2_Chr11g0482581 [Helianthus annuus]KAJ0874506.1 hypothetical protein HanPSC8_Chr11g0464901 [Helianthus annuus]